jgi:dienelactone hydrolase
MLLFTHFYSFVIIIYGGKRMKKTSFVKPSIIFGVCILVSFFCVGLAALIQSGFGAVSIESGFFTPERRDAAGGLPVRIAYKLYRPKTATAANPAPAVLVMHGYQNDKETSAAFSIELARRGITALSIDLYGHGGTSPGMRGRGGGKYKLTNLDKTISGPSRFLLMMTFSVLDFFHPEISSGLADSSMGGKSAYRYLASLPFVNSKQIGITGHSMGTWASWSVAAAFPEHRALALQCGELFPPAYYDSNTIRFNNVLLLQARYDEFDYFRDYQRNVIGLEKTSLRYHDFMGQNEPVSWNKTYGDFANGSARRMELIQNNHRLTTHDNHALTTTINWFTKALEVNSNLADSNLVYMIKEVLILLSMLAALVSMLPLFLILSSFKFFAPLAQPLDQNPEMLSPLKRWITAVISMLISGLTFPFLGQLGHGLIPVPENIFRMTIGNGFITWLTFLTLVSIVLLVFWRRGQGGKWSLSNLGLAGNPLPGLPFTRPANRSSKIIPRAILMAFILTGLIYGLVCINTRIFQLDFRFIWPFFRPFSPLRFSQFWVYLPFYGAFFLVNAGVKLYGQLRLPERKSPALTQLVWWAYSVLVMLGGVCIIALVEYIPFFMGYGPGVDLLFSPLFGGPFMSVMILLIPQFAVFFFLSTWLYRKSGTVYTGSFVVAILAAWVLSGGSAMF